MRPVVKAFAVAVVLLAVAGLLAEPPTKEEIAKAVKQLGDDDFTVRQKASNLLRAAGQAAEAALKEAAKSPDAEVARRAMEILEDFKWGLYPDTPKNIQALVQRYRSGDDGEKRVVCRELGRLGKTGYSTLVKVAAAEENPQMKRAIFHELAVEATESAGANLLAGNYAGLEGLLELGLSSGSDVAFRHYAAQLHFRRLLDDKIKEYKAQLAEKEDAQKAEVLAYLCRAKGDLDGARWAADKSGNKRLSKGILGERGDWAELAKHLDKGDDPDEFGIEKMTYSLAYHRLAGNAEGFDKDLKQLRKFSEDRPDDPEYAWLAAKALFLNDRPQEALDLLLKAKVYHPAFEVLCFQAKYAEAFELAEKAADAKPDQALAMQLGKARALALLGKKEQALELFTKLAEQLGDRDDYPSIRDLIRIQFRVGYKDQAFEHCVALLKKLKDDEDLLQLLDLAFSDHAQSATVWWKLLRTKHTADESAAILKQIRMLAEGKLPDKELQDMLRLADKEGPNLKAVPDAAVHEAVAFVLEAAGKKDMEQQYLERLDPKTAKPALLQRLGDLYAAKKAFDRAAERYQQAWDSERTQPLPLFLRGWALGQAGQEAESRRLKELAHWLPLGNEQVRYQFSRALAERGFPDDARQEYELILRLGRLDGYIINETLRHVGYVHQGRKEYAKAAEWFEQFRLRCMQVRVSFVEYGAHVQVPTLVHQNRAREHAAAGKFDEARKELEHCFALMPTGNVNLVIQLFLSLEKANRKQEASAIFDQAYGIHDKLSKAYPNNATEHNTLAWLGACCRQQLDRAEEHANQAVKLTPDNAGCMDTLAEVLFQRGQQARALELMKRCIELEPKNDYFKKQLKRFEAGDPKAEVPEEEE